MLSLNPIVRNNDGDFREKPLEKEMQGGQRRDASDYREDRDCPLLSSGFPYIKYFFLSESVPLFAPLHPGGGIEA